MYLNRIGTYYLEEENRPMRKNVLTLLVLLSLVLSACGGDGGGDQEQTTGQAPGGSPAAQAPGGSPAAQAPGGSPAAEEEPAEQAPPGTLQIWWNKGYYPEEDEALEQIVAEWEEQTGNNADLSFYSTEDIPRKTLSAVQSGAVPDIAYAHFADWQLIPRLAWDGKLADVSDVVQPLEDQYSEAALNSVRLQNNAEDKRSYYAVPIVQQTIHTFYWRDMLQQAGLSEDQIPEDWDGFWNFWGQCQQAMRDQGERVYALGLPMSTGASDTYFTFEQIMEAYDVQLVDQEGNLQVDDPAVRDGIIQALTFYTNFHAQGQVPPGAVNWQDPDNNLNFLNRTTCMTPNATLSIPASQRDENPQAYQEQIGTREWPPEPDGEPITYLVSVKSAMVFEEGQDVELAKDFMRFLTQPENLGEYVKGSLGRWFPVMEQLLEDPFWQAEDDPHIPVAVRQFTERETRPFYQVYNPAYSQVSAENVWGRAIGRVVVEGQSPEQAADEAIGRIKQLFEAWQ
jgi:multiple sugar transport system substrate-binding protein